MGMSWLLTCCWVAEHLGLLITLPYVLWDPEQVTVSLQASVSTLCTMQGQASHLKAPSSSAAQKFHGTQEPQAGRQGWSQLKLPVERGVMSPMNSNHPLTGQGLRARATAATSSALPALGTPLGLPWLKSLCLTDPGQLGWAGSVGSM